jgi:hypothetical protein
MAREAQSGDGSSRDGLRHMLNKGSIDEDEDLKLVFSCSESAAAKEEEL